MSEVYNPESEIIASIERLKLEARDIRRKIEHAPGQADKRALNRLLKEIGCQIEFLKNRLS